jgi:post-segregation antitoxin (ccd killing protein)
MEEIKLKISDDLMEELKKFPDLKLSEIVERTLRKEIEERKKTELLLTALNKILKGSKMNDKDALKLGEEIKEKMLKRYEAEGW